jgi:hypothetical protein
VLIEDIADPAPDGNPDFREPLTLNGNGEGIYAPGACSIASAYHGYADVLGPITLGSDSSILGSSYILGPVNTNGFVHTMQGDAYFCDLPSLVTGTTRSSAAACAWGCWPTLGMGYCKVSGAA